MTVRTRLIVSFAAVAALLLLPGLFAAARLAELRDIAVEGRGRQAAAALAVGRIQARLAELDRYERSYVAARDSTLWGSAERAKALIREEMDSLRASPYAHPAATLDGVLDSLMAATDRVHTLMEGGRVAQATESFGALEPLFTETELRLRALADSIDRLAQDDFNRAEAISNAARRSTLAEVAFFLVVALLLAGWTTRTLTRPLRRLAAATTAVAAGNLEAPVDLPYDQSDEVGVLSNAFRRMTRRLADLDRMKAEFVGVASHELKTPINVINGYTELIEEEMAGELTEHQRQILDGIAEQSRNMGRLVSRLMDISRLEAGSYRMEFEPIHVEDLLTGLLRSFDILASRQGVALTTRIHDSAPERVVVDVDIIRDEVLGNLVSNGIRHTPRGGWVRVEVWGAADTVVFQVSDSGAGIPQDHRPFIFEKYYQAERSRAVGAGLGLAIAREMVDAHGGSITLEPAQEGVGAIFHVTLPRDRAR
ncbi:MAG TPA: HAMP domain-containing sensor histidine kinase [Longimicrobiales bacterium]|nr:HAMP domain-containing sensor histidine kinase [Longimicrobiales bacterium]